MSKIYLASDIQTDSIVDGKGLRTVIWFQGCSHNCKGCHNPKTFPFNTGIELDTKDIFNMIDNLEDQDGITFSGGDPMFQPEAFLEILKYSKSKGYNNWAYTGFLYEDILNKDKVYLEILKYIDVLIDGKFVLEEKTFEAKYRGSRNQRLIDVQKSLKNNKVVVTDEN